MELTSSSRSVLSSCNRPVARALCRTAYPGARRKEKGIVCILSEEKEVVQRTIRRRAAFSLLLASPVLSVAFSAYGKSKTMNPYDERRLLQQNKKIQEANRAPEDFPNFIREDIDTSGFEEGIRDMKPGGKRRIIIPPELGPPVGPSTFFSAKQFEVFDVELLAVQDCQRRTIAFYSDVVCS
ncbi:Peptidyl-prolyl cis-trans isomerase FKBP20-2, chloroplastic [Zea mays]|uniref:Rotamase n=1 Tax=Zea mays TaxID=4577 RepID=A0A3L6DYD8_MAIZE|nr:Peptidyl-prolyl cis-trans isomerase FKBP20-2, chloroplastic [Zea mays]